MTKPTTMPDALIVSPAAYADLLGLAEWLDATPVWVDLSEGMLEEIDEHVSDLLEPLLPEDALAMSVETEGESLVAVVEDETGEETRVPVSMLDPLTDNRPVNPFTNAQDR